MNRCTSYLLSALLLAASLPALAQTDAPGDSLPGRQFPKAVLRGEMVVLAPPEITLDGKPERLSPGARIRGTDNLLQMSGALIGQRLLVNFTLDPAGNLLDVWVLSPAEASRQPWPVTPQQAATWAFNPDTQSWSRP